MRAALSLALLGAVLPLVSAGGKGKGPKGTVTQIRNKNQWDTLLKYHKLSTGLPVVVDFYSDGCGPCRMMAPIYKQMAQEYAGRAVFTKVDVNAVNIGQQIRSMPTFQFWMNGKKMQEFSGGDEGSLRRITQDLARKARAMNMEITAENLFEFYKVHDKSKTLKDCQKLLSRNIPIDKLVASLRQKYKAKPKLTQKDRRKKKKKGDKAKYVDGSVRLELADLEELEEMVRKVKVESGQLEEDGGGADAGGDDNDEGGEEANPFEEFMPGGFVGRAASEDADKPEAVAIVGGGPAALSAAVYCARAGLRPVVVAPPVGGQLMGKGVDVENYPGLLDMTGPGIVHQMRRQALSFNTAFDGQYITSVDFATKPFKLTTNTSKVLRTHAVILATGADSNWLDVPGEYDFRGKGISSCATCDGFLFRDKPVVVIGGGDTAMEDALVLARTSSSVTVIHRRGTFRASRVLAQRVLSNSKITVRWNATVKEFTANTKEKMEDGSHPVGHVIVTDTSTGEESSIDCDAAFVAIGHSPNTGFVEGQVEMDENKYLTVKPGTSHTSVEGVFAAGDVHDHVYRQAITSAGSGAMAALDAERWLSETGFVIEDEPAAEVPAATAVENETAKAKAKEGVDGLNLDAAAAAAADAAGANFDKDL